uniref:Uncharacterized protein n=1 Tax=Romanomermis culicivorax TaxID=13658 RepID=A0A915JDH6_ROMCU
FAGRKKAPRNEKKIQGREEDVKKTTNERRLLTSRWKISAVPLEINSRACRVISGPNTSNAMGAESTTMAPVNPSTSNGSLSRAHSKCGYFLAKSADQMAPIASVMDNESVNEKSLKSRTYKDF